VTTKLSASRATIEPFPQSCPKCGAPTRAETVARHLKNEHLSSIGTAVLMAEPSVSRPFAYVGPAHGESSAWWIVWIDLPLTLSKLRHREWSIKWVVGTGPTEGER
jgi:hypothetical protein